ncbi:DUF4037 domain-containing protein [Alkalihalophilus marmarensis]|jgi:hypothetical protein|uniref:Uncharacterized protein n=1 Tax=Alkalihalophilus marmarensis DSM 21297 TaxID=1188261 RepID=U6SRG3_9BACI|nr:DUF4037 domain-containing protein [Alkalihalophilus marmarensis]ERN53942.1 hypothetical protein A33I_09060 [Alkalihalophilus marmarensis DSM 21297]MCM3491111.1 DUF4037 domain-containing protein [Alkalihalophilus marmarensis]
MNLERLASQISNFYKQNQKIEAVLLGGSVSRNWHDKHSDIELFVFWKGAPTDDERKAPIIELNGNIIDFHPYEEEEWSESYITQGVKFEISNFLTETIHKVIRDVITSYDTDLDKQCILATVYNGVTLSGDLVINSMKEKVSKYPYKLSVAMVKENLYLGNRWNNREALLERKDWLMLYKVMTEVQTKLMGILFGLNRQFVHHPAFKWQKQTLDSMEVTPENIVNRLASTFLEDPNVSVRELEAIIQETYELIKCELPQIDVSFVVDKSLYLRPRND